MNEDTIRQADGATVRFGEVTALDAVSFEVAKGSVHAVIGPNGVVATPQFRGCDGLRDP